LTSISERDLDADGVELYRKLRDSGELNCRVYVMHSVDAQLPIELLRNKIAEIAQGALHKPDNMLWVRGIKTYLDGGMLTGSAYMLRPWGVSKVYSIDDPAYRGMRYIDAGKLYQIAKFALENDLQFTAHSVGDGAVQAMVDAYSELNNDIPVRTKRPSITHSNFIPTATIAKMKQFGIVLDMQPAWLWLDGATLEKQFGYDRLSVFQPYKALFDHGIVAGGGSDHMQKIGSFRSVNPYNPFLAMWITLTRHPRWTEKALHPEQRISREQALRLYTINNAYMTFSETQKGSLEPGKLADFIVIDRDYLSCPVDRIKDIKVDETWLGGKRVFLRQ
jgi:predicted amidohydrolase YtcJ